MQSAVERNFHIVSDYRDCESVDAVAVQWLRSIIRRLKEAGEEPDGCLLVCGPMFPHRVPPPGRDRLVHCRRHCYCYCNRR
jgi:hypothetical protein